MTSTIFDRASYDAGLRDAITTVLDDWAFRYPGITDVEHVYFHAATAATPDTIRGYLEQAHELGRTFDREPPPADPSRSRTSGSTRTSP
jgi:NAD(P)H dehydrogenase (quinone)